VRDSGSAAGTVYAPFCIFLNYSILNILILGTICQGDVLVLGLLCIWDCLWTVPFPETSNGVQFVTLLGTVTECRTAVVCCQSVKERSSDELQYINQQYDAVQIMKYNSR
jgi:hypothetical protein